MKKNPIIAILFILAFVCSSCNGQNNDKKLVNNLVGTWEGSIYIDDEEIPTDYQFFESTNGTTGNFIEIAYLHEYDGDFDIRYFAYVSGEYTVKNGKLSLTYLPETISTEPYDEKVLIAYAAALMAYYQEEGKELLWEDESELAESILEILAEEWDGVCVDRNNTNGDFSNLTVTEKKMSFKAGSRTLEFNRADHDWFTAYPFAE